MATYTASPTASEYDASENSAGVVTLTGNDNANDAGARIGYVFLACDIPKGSTINSATLQVNLTSGSFDDPRLNIYAGLRFDYGLPWEDSNNFLSEAFTLSTAFAVWSANGIGTGNKTSPSLVAPIQELINHSSWSYGYALYLMLVAFHTDSDFRVASYDTGTPAILNIDYTPPSAGAHAHRKTQQTRLFSKVGAALT